MKSKRREMKKSFVASIMALVICFAPSAYCGGIPVFDAAGEATSIMNTVMEIAKMVEQIDQLKKQYDQLQQTYSAMTGGRGLGTIMNDSSNKNYLPDDWKGVYDGIKSGGYSGLTGSGQSVMNNNRIYDACASMTGGQKNICERQVALAAQDRAYSGEAYDKAKGRLGQIEGLMGQASGTQDQKAILELNARLQAENAMIQNEQIKLQMYRMVAESEQRLAEQQQKELGAKETAKRGSSALGTVNFEFPQ